MKHTTGALLREFWKIQKSLHFWQCPRAAKFLRSYKNRWLEHESHRKAWILVRISFFVGRIINGAETISWTVGDKFRPPGMRIRGIYLWTLFFSVYLWIVQFLYHITLNSQSQGRPRATFVSPQYGTFSMSPIWCLEFLGGSHIFENICIFAINIFGLIWDTTAGCKILYYSYYVLFH